MSAARATTKNLALLAARGLLGGYMAAHGAQKLFGSFGGYGPDGTGGYFESIGLKPGKPMAQVAGATELAGGALTAAGIADPLGPIAIAGSMAVAATVHKSGGPFATNGGYELPVTNIAFATLLAATGPGALRLGPRLSGKLTTLTVLGGAGIGAYLVKMLLDAQKAQADATPVAGAATVDLTDTAASIDTGITTPDAGE